MSTADTDPASAAPTTSTLATSTVAGLSADGQGRQRDRARIAHTVSTLVLTGLVAAVAVDGLRGVAIFGVDSATSTAHGGGYELRVHSTSVSRPALASPFDIVVRRPGGFDGPVTLAVSREYWRMWDTNALVPTPSSETATADWWTWGFDPPDGDTLAVSYDARIEPAAQRGAHGTVAVLEDGRPVVTLDVQTRLWP